jgi:hypothetical protein
MRNLVANVAKKIHCTTGMEKRDELLLVPMAQLANFPTARRAYSAFSIAK